MLHELCCDFVVAKFQPPSTTREISTKKFDQQVVYFTATTIDTIDQEFKSAIFYLFLPTTTHTLENKAISNLNFLKQIHLNHVWNTSSCQCQSYARWCHESQLSAPPWTSRKSDHDPVTYSWKVQEGVEGRRSFRRGENEWCSAFEVGPLAFRFCEISWWLLTYGLCSCLSFFLLGYSRRCPSCSDPPLMYSRIRDYLIALSSWIDNQ